MTDIGGGSSMFDAAFLLMQAAGGTLWIALFALGRIAPPARRRAAFALQLTACVLAPLVWNVGFPPHSGIDGAARILLGAPASMANGLIGTGWAAWAGRANGGSAWRVAWPFLLAVTTCGVGWTLFLFA